jgi:hypothetical protein
MRKPPRTPKPIEVISRLPKKPALSVYKQYEELVRLREQVRNAEIKLRRNSRGFNPKIV